MMKAMILAAGLGTRLKPWTLSHPKALVPVGGVPMLERVILSLKRQGFDRIVINIHHFGEQIIEFLAAKDFGVSISISDERGLLLDTGGGIQTAAPLLFDEDDSPVLIHNVDILSNADLEALMSAHKKNKGDATLLVSERESSRKLIVDPDDMSLQGWHNLKTTEIKPNNFESHKRFIELSFSGIHVVTAGMVEKMRKEQWPEVFPIMDYYLSHCGAGEINCHRVDGLRLIDIGKPETLQQANLQFV